MSLDTETTQSNVQRLADAKAAAHEADAEVSIAREAFDQAIARRREADRELENAREAIEQLTDLP